MSRRNAAIAGLVLALLVPAGSTAPNASAGDLRVPPSARGRAQQNLLAALQRGWGRSWLVHQPGGRRWLRRIVDPRTGLLRNNTRAFCRHLRRRNRFACVVRPARYRRYEGFYVAYRNLGNGRFKLRALYYKRGRGAASRRR